MSKNYTEDTLIFESSRHSFATPYPHTFRKWTVTYCIFWWQPLTAALGALVQELGDTVFVLSQVGVAFRPIVALRVLMILVAAHDLGILATTTAVRSSGASRGVGRSVSGVSFATHGDDVKNLVK